MKGVTMKLRGYMVHSNYFPLWSANLDDDVTLSGNYAIGSESRYLDSAFLDSWIKKKKNLENRLN